MRKKPKAKKAVTVSPKIPVSQKAVEISTLDEGDFFLYAGELYVLEQQDPKALLISQDSFATIDLYAEDMVVPVDVEIKWSYRK